MQKKLTQFDAVNAKPKDQLYKIRDTVLRGLFLRVTTSGLKTWYIDYIRPGTNERTDYKLGSLELFTVAKARDFARTFLASVRLGQDPGRKKKTDEPKQQVDNLKYFFEHHYIPWFVMTHKRGRDGDLRILQSEFAFLGSVD